MSKKLWAPDSRFTIKMKYSILWMASFALGGAGAWVVSCWGNGLGLLDRSNERSSHDGVVPKGGGIGILAAFLVASGVLGLPLLFWISIGLISIVSFCGDRKEISPKFRLSAQFLTGIGLLVGLFYLGGRPWGMYLLTPFLSVFVVGTANYYNFMDGINGIAGITGVIGFGLLAFYASTSGADHWLAILSVCISLSCLGFLPFNLPKAKVFMGDVGSVLLGFVFATLVVMLSKSFLDFICLAAFLFPFYADELTTLVVRIKDGDSEAQSAERRAGSTGGVAQQAKLRVGWMGRLMKPHRKHLYQLMVNEKRISHWKVSVGYGMFQLLVGICMLVVRPIGIVVVMLLLAAWFAGFVWVSCVVRRSLSN